jgi:hypothetical protein
LVHYNLNGTLINADLTPQIKQLSELVKSEQALRAIQSILRTRQRLTHNSAPLLQIEALTVKLIK